MLFVLWHLTLQEDALVNSVGNTFDLTTGKVAQALLAKAGPGLAQECSALAPINDSEVKVTGAYNLPCKKIMHCNCPQWQGPTTIQVMSWTPKLP